MGRFGNLGRNVFTGPSAYNWDFSLFKNFKFKESQNIQFRAEMFNIFNTPQYSNPGSTTTAPATFGKSLTTIPAVGVSAATVRFSSRCGTGFERRKFSTGPDHDAPDCASLFHTMHLAAQIFERRYAIDKRTQLPGRDPRKHLVEFRGMVTASEP